MVRQLQYLHGIFFCAIAVREATTASSSFFILSNTITEDTISFVQEIIPYFTNALKSNDEELILAASEFGVALVSYPQGYDLLSSSEGLNIIFFLAENSKYAIKKNMILIICEIIMQSNTERRHFLISLNVLDILFAFIASFTKKIFEKR